MAYTYNDVQNSKAVFALEDDPFETGGEEGMDAESWAALQKAAAIPPLDPGTGSVTVASEMSIEHIVGVSKAMLKLNEAQSVANIHVVSNNFIRDSITGK